MERSIKNNSPYLPTLDGWRAIAILAVIFHHDAVHTAGVFNTRWLYEYGNAGVDLFFAISGLLICTRLLAEEASYGRICLGQFYLRRCLRILPPALVYLATIAILGSMSVISVGVADWWSSLLFCRNYPDLLGSTHGVTGWYTSHFWSLSLEEQFYLGLPALLALIPKDQRATVFWILAAGIFADRLLVLSSHPWLQVQFHVGVRMDALLVPALFAVLASEPQRKAWMRRSLRFWPLIAACLLLMVPLGKGSAWHVSLLVWLMPCIVLGSVLNPENAIGRLLEWSPLRWIGRISYSLYLWQQLFFTLHFRPGHAPIRWWQSWPARFLLTGACALGSYFLVERPFSRLGHRPSTTKSPAMDRLGRPEPAEVLGSGIA